MLKLKNNSIALVNLIDISSGSEFTVKSGDSIDINESQVDFLSRYLNDLNLQIIDEPTKPEVVKQASPAAAKQAKQETAKVDPPKQEVKVEKNSNFKEDELKALTTAQLYEIIEKSGLKSPEGDKAEVIKFIMATPSVVKPK